ncbi:phage N-6-adenine-methyltransferase [Acidithiobacillus montserratensis]|uniref:Phage N-6-adenine-methyltransferase n=1 Tax=Acidithiobacillus montserratensis TaxID=2729135 RepID=A0ACD5HCM9_9PROT|nr:phage N-6-adenine-methyltransferase [Acidithiobacillus montserratensis]MBU2749194.1 hypothetical protein [Acidithiobacillus montserratensis]
MSSKPRRKTVETPKVGRPRVHASDRERWRAAQQARRKRLKQKNQRHQGLFSSLSQEWYTPPEIYRPILSALQREDFDCDPASPHLDGPIPAQVRFTATENGLLQPWHGVVWLNPPYGRAIRLWVQKALQEVQQGRADCIILLVPVRSDTQWWWALMEAGAEVAYLRGRIRFLQANGERAAASPFPSAIVTLRLRP